MPAGAVIEPRLLKPDTEANLQRLFKEKEWTDFYPIILPTEEKSGGNAQGTSHKPDEVVSKFGSRELTVEKAAIFAVMAGAKPEYFPTILATAHSGDLFRQLHKFDGKHDRRERADPQTAGHEFGNRRDGSLQ